MIVTLRLLFWNLFYGCKRTYACSERSIQKLDPPRYKCPRSETWGPSSIHDQIKSRFMKQLSSKCVASSGTQLMLRPFPLPPYSLALKRKECFKMGCEKEVCVWKRRDTFIYLIRILYTLHAWFKLDLNWLSDNRRHGEADLSIEHVHVHIFLMLALAHLHVEVGNLFLPILGSATNCSNVTKNPYVVVIGAFIQTRIAIGKFLLMM